MGLLVYDQKKLDYIFENMESFMVQARVGWEYSIWYIGVFKNKSLSSNTII